MPFPDPYAATTIVEISRRLQARAARRNKLPATITAALADGTAGAWNCAQRAVEPARPLLVSFLQVSSYPLKKGNSS
jgi:hypothetical protein